LQDDRTERWRAESAFFDEQVASEYDRLEPIDPRTMIRYSTWRRRRVAKEAVFRLIGPLENKRVLDLGCGDGTNAVQLAKLGARVVAIDISPGSIAVGRKRAQLDGVSDRITFICSPIETASLGQDRFDMITGFAFLHHVIPELEAVIARLVDCLGPTGRIVFVEPINRCHVLRRLRQSLPIKGDFTPDERPLEEPELDILRRHIARLTIRPYNLFGRVVPYVLGGRYYEHVGRARRAFIEAIWLADYALLSLPLLERLGGTAILSGERPESVAQP
jgi:2-polyprenyl-3-methyl-5-hydroxy-6-metoxy-1,4-benzoquinol methylase